MPWWRHRHRPTVGQLELTRFPNEGGLNAIGNNLVLETPGSGSPQAGVPGSTGYGNHPAAFLEPPTSTRWTDHRADHRPRAYE